MGTCNRKVLLGFDILKILLLHLQSTELSVTWTSSFEDHRCCSVSSILASKAHRWWHIRLGYICSFVCRPSATSVQLFRKANKDASLWVLCFKQTNFKITLKLKLKHPCCHCSCLSPRPKLFYVLSLTKGEAFRKTLRNYLWNRPNNQLSHTQLHPDPTSAGAALGTPLEGPLGPFLSQTLVRWVGSLLPMIAPPFCFAKIWLQIWLLWIVWSK